MHKIQNNLPSPKGKWQVFVTTCLVILVAIALYDAPFIGWNLSYPMAPGMSASTTTVRVAVAQIRVIDGNIPANISTVETYVQRAASAGARIVLLPELVDVGFGQITHAASGGENARPIPGETSDALGLIAIRYNMWIATALLEKVPDGAYDTNVLIDNQGKVVLKQRKAFVYPSFGGVPAFQGNYHDAQIVDSPWGPIGVMNCKDTEVFAKRAIFAEQRPTLMLLTFANPGGDLLTWANALATECDCPVAGSNMVFSNGTGGQSRFVGANGTTLWEGPRGIEALNVFELSLDITSNRSPTVDAGEVQTIRLPNHTVALSGYVTDDGWPNGSLTTNWSKVSGPGAIVFADSRAVSTSATFSAAGVYVLRL